MAESVRLSNNDAPTNSTTGRPNRRVSNFQQNDFETLRRDTEVDSQQLTNNQVSAFRTG